MHVERTTLFSRDELAAAFALLLPRPRAEALATRWFEHSADEIDQHGRYLYPGPWNRPGGSSIPAPAGTPSGTDWDSPAWVAFDERTFAYMDEDDAEECFMALSDLHLALVALVSEELYQRMRIARGATEAQAARRRLQMIRAVRAYRRRMGWPPAV